MVKQFKHVKINCDLGEGRADDAALMPYLHSCSIACGGHYGDSNSIRTAIELALLHDVKVGAHPSFPDRENFGRMEMKMDLNALEQSIISQLNDFDAVCKSLTTKMHHVKLHGALYHLAANDETVAQLLVRILESYPGVLLYAPFGSVLARIAKSKTPVYLEAFIDRSYEDDLSLVHRSKPNAVIYSPEKAWRQLETIFNTESVTSVNGERISIKADTFCIHGDNDRALAILEYIHHQIQLNAEAY